MQVERELLALEALKCCGQPYVPRLLVGGSMVKDPNIPGAQAVPLQGTAVEAATLPRGSADGIGAIAASGRINGSCVHDAHVQATFFCCMIMSVEVCLACSQGDRSSTLT